MAATILCDLRVVAWREVTGTTLYAALNTSFDEGALPHTPLDACVYVGDYTGLMQYAITQAAAAAAGTVRKLHARIDPLDLVRQYRMAARHAAEIDDFQVELYLGNGRHDPVSRTDVWGMESSDELISVQHALMRHMRPLDGTRLADGERISYSAVKDGLVLAAIYSGEASGGLNPGRAFPPEQFVPVLDRPSARLGQLPSGMPEAARLVPSMRLYRLDAEDTCLRDAQKWAPLTRHVPVLRIGEAVRIGGDAEEPAFISDIVAALERDHAGSAEAAIKAYRELGSSSKAALACAAWVVSVSTAHLLSCFGDAVQRLRDKLVGRFVEDDETIRFTVGYARACEIRNAPENPRESIWFDVRYLQSAVVVDMTPSAPLAFPPPQAPLQVVELGMDALAIGETGDLFAFT